MWTSQKKGGIEKEKEKIVGGGGLRGCLGCFLPLRFGNSFSNSVLHWPLCLIWFFLKNSIKEKNSNKLGNNSCLWIYFHGHILILNVCPLLLVCFLQLPKEQERKLLRNARSLKELRWVRLMGLACQGWLYRRNSQVVNSLVHQVAG